MYTDIITDIIIIIIIIIHCNDNNNNNNNANNNNLISHIGRKIWHFSFQFHIYLTYGDILLSKRKEKF